jgi:hypothetical protein
MAAAFASDSRVLCRHLHLKALETAPAAAFARYRFVARRWAVVIVRHVCPVISPGILGGRSPTGRSELRKIFSLTYALAYVNEVCHEGKAR